MNKYSSPFFINSNNRVSGDINDANYIFNGLSMEDLDHSILLKEFQIFNDFYNINNFNNNFVLGITNNYDITIDTNKYTRISFANYITNNAPSYGITGFSMSYGNTSLKLTMSNETGGGVYIKKTSNKSKYLGLDLNTDYVIEDNGTLTSDKGDFSGTRKIIIETSINVDSYNSENRNKDRLDEIYIDNSFDAKIHYINEFPISTNTSQINELNIKLLDENGDLLQTEKNYDFKLLLMGNV